jgi:hypothetical protein
MQVVLYSPTLGTLDLTARGSSSGRDFDIWLANYDMGILQPDLSAIEGMFGDIQNQTGFADRTPTFHIAVRADTEIARAAGGEMVGKWINAGDCELRYVPDEGPTSCLLILSGYTSHVAAPSGGDDKFGTEWQGSQFRWYEVHLTTAPQVLSAEADSASLSGAGIASGVVTIEGTFPAAATVTATSNAGLGQTIIYTSPHEYVPALRSTLSTSGGTITRTGAQHFYKGSDSANWEKLNGALFEAPATDLPAGDYAFVAHVFNNSSSAQTLLPTMTVTTFVGGSAVGNVMAGSLGVAIGATTEALVSLGGVTIDRGGISAGAEASTIVQIAASGLPADLYFDEVFAFKIDAGSSLTILDAGAGASALGSAHSRVTIAASPRPDQVASISRGLLSDTTRSIGPGSALAQMEAPMLPPGDNFVYVAAAGVDATVNATVEYRSAHATYVDAA